jgi:hypothetical protein
MESPKPEEKADWKSTKLTPLEIANNVDTDSPSQDGRGSRSRENMPNLNAIKILMQEDQIDPHLSPQDNAIVVLSSLLSQDLSDKVMASVVYALHVLKMDSVSMAVPTGLGLDNTTKHGKSSEESRLSDDVILDWLVSSYTPKPRIVHKKKISFKSLATSIRHAIKLFGRRAVITNEVYLDDREATTQALVGVDEWDWDVWRLREASKNRPLQALGWHLLHEWGIFEELKLDGSIVRNWLAFVESLYQDTPYHSSTHAADVLQVLLMPLLSFGSFPHRKSGPGCHFFILFSRLPGHESVA